MTARATSEAPSARKTASERVVKACHQTIDPTPSRLDDELFYIVADMALLARAIQAMAESPVVIGARDGVLLEGFEKRQVSDVLRLAMWIDDVAQQALADLEGRAPDPKEAA